MNTAPSRAKARRTLSRSSSLPSRLATASRRRRLKPWRSAGAGVAACSSTALSLACGASSRACSRQRTNASSRVLPWYWRCRAPGVSQASTRPACISEMRSQRWASFMKWVERKMVTPCSRDSSTSRRQKSSRAAGSTPEVGSSRISTSGRCSTATASDRRWRRPRGRAPDGWSAMAPRSKRSISSSIRWALSALGRSNRRACRVRFCRVLSSPYSEKLCDMKPTRLRVARSLASTGRPSRLALPSLAGIRPVSTFIVVVLPQPLEPRKPKISPRPMAKLTLFTAVKSPKRRVRSWASMATEVSVAGRGGMMSGGCCALPAPW
ncbi:hypothetical protein D3C78_370180 [compost metagenome]